MSAHTEVLAKIRALHALAADATKRGSLHEANAAAMRADEMIQRYRLDAATIDIGEDPGAIETVELFESRRAVAWRSSLAVALARHNDCQVYLNRGRVVTIQLVGYPEDVSLVRHMFAWLSLEISRLAQDCSGRAARHAFCLGAVRGFSTALARAKAAATKAHAQGASAAIVLRDRADSVERFLAENVELRKAKRVGSYSDSEAYLRGHMAGARLSVNHSKALNSKR